MEIPSLAVKKASQLKAVKKRNGRYMVRRRGGGLVSAADKVTFLQDQGLVKKLMGKAKPAEGESAPS